MSDQSPPLFEVRNLVKAYPRVRAVDGVSFSIREGICFGMLGPNGAGKTTTIEIMEGISKPTSGDVWYRGAPLGMRYRHDVGIQFQTTALQEKQTCRETLVMFGRLYRRTVPIDRLIELCNLGEFINRDTHKISGGQRQRLLLALALVNDPRVIFMDEPTTGLDPSARRGFWDIANAVKAQGKTLILTTHYMEEAEILCDDLVIMHRGHVIAQGRPADLLTRYFNITTLEFPLREGLAGEIPQDLRPEVHGDLVQMQVSDVTDAMRRLLDARIDLRQLTVRKPSLEDLFLQLTAPGRDG